MAGEIDAYGNPIGSDDGDGQQIIFPQITMDQALSTAKQESKKKEPFSNSTLDLQQRVVYEY